ncbi:MAG TPA: hypothetical protein VK509_04610 [Polyangiales bacterium]|nr:hypothetical protein [Polyangiales bacterium]
MAELSPEARALLAAAAGADDPTPEQRSRADAAARLALALHGATDLPPLDPARTHGGAANGANGASGANATAKLGTAASGWKLALGAAALIAAALLGTRAPQPRPQPAQQYAKRIELPEPQPAAQAIAQAETAVPADQPKTQRSTSAIPARLQAEASTRSADARAPARARPAAQATPTLQAEVELIASANGLIRARRFAEAEDVLATHARRHPHGALREERAALAVLVLCETGSHERALGAMQRFLRSAPQSVLAQRVRAACEALPGPEP